MFDVVVGRAGALLAGGAVFVMLLAYWLFVPLRVAHRGGRVEVRSANRCWKGRVNRKPVRI